MKHSRCEIQSNLPGLLKMLGGNIYAEPDVAVCDRNVGRILINGPEAG
jgi:hypothetical protein